MNPLTAYLETSPYLSFAYIPDLNYFDITINSINNPVGSVFYGKCIKITPRGCFIELNGQQAFTKFNVPLNNYFIGQCVRPPKKQKAMLLSPHVLIQTPYVTASYDQMHNTWTYTMPAQKIISDNLYQQQVKQLQTQLATDLLATNQKLGCIFKSTAVTRLLSTLRPNDILHTNQPYALPDINVHMHYQSLEKTLDINWDDLVFERLEKDFTKTLGKHSVTMHVDNLDTCTVIDMDADLDISSKVCTTISLQMLQNYLQYTQPIGLILIDFISTKNRTQLYKNLKSALHLDHAPTYHLITCSPTCVVEIHGKINNNFLSFFCNIPHEEMYLQQKQLHNMEIQFKKTY